MSLLNRLRRQAKIESLLYLPRVMNSYFRPGIDAIAGYVPGEQPKPGIGIPVIKLNTNENPYPPSPAAIEVLRNLILSGCDDIQTRLPMSFVKPRVKC